MILSCHLLAGAAIAAKVHNPALALILAFLSHYFLDLFPQKEYSIINIEQRRWNKSYLDFFKVFLDISFGLLLILFLSDNTPLIFMAAFLAILPDGSTLLYHIFPKNKLLAKHWNFHTGFVNNFHDRVMNNFSESKKIPLFWKIFCQILVVLAAIYLL